MSNRREELAERMQRQVLDTLEFLSQLTEAELRLPCPDEGFGGTVGAVAAHVAAAYGRATAILQPRRSVPAGRGPGSAHVVGPHMGPRPRGEADGVDLAATILRLRRHGKEVVDLVRSYPEHELGRPLPTETARFANMGKPVEMIIEYMIYLQASHLHTMRAVVRQRRGERSGGQQAGTARRERFSA
ncbi:DinB family protein [Streptomyces sp. NPDC006668]|uniref:DinB family protein n=1 Tax=Streptomyces sp. NPDC006668 TaxID=3156903 RepID=UPI0010559A21